MPASTARLFDEMRESPLLNSFTLIGGTALCLHIGHRLSEDLNFITLLPKLPRAALKALEKELERKGHTIRHQVNLDAYEDFQTVGLELADSQQDWMVDGNVKITFFSAEPQHAKLLNWSQAEEAKQSGFKIASFIELCRLKAIVTASRSKSRDWLDLYLLERDYQFGIADWKEAFDLAGLTMLQFEIALKRMCEGSLGESDEGFSSLLPDAPSVCDMQERFKILRHEYERALARIHVKKSVE
jgi:hypothetical protein